MATERYFRLHQATSDKIDRRMKSFMDAPIDLKDMPDFVSSDSYVVGDVVRLNSSSALNDPMMTVWSVRDDGIVDTRWFNAAGELKRDAFAPAELLKRVYPEE